MVELKEDIVVIKREGRKCFEVRRFKTIKEAVEFACKTRHIKGVYGWLLSDIRLILEYLDSMETDLENYPNKIVELTFNEQSKVWTKNC